MPRLRHAQSGAVVSCSEETATRLGSEWTDVDEKPRQKTSTKRAASKSSDSSK